MMPGSGCIGAEASWQRILVCSGVRRQTVRRAISVLSIAAYIASRRTLGGCVFVEEGLMGGVDSEPPEHCSHSGRSAGLRPQIAIVSSRQSKKSDSEENNIQTHVGVGFPLTTSQPVQKYGYAPKRIHSGPTKSQAYQYDRREIPR